MKINRLIPLLVSMLSFTIPASAATLISTLGQPQAGGYQLFASFLNSNFAMDFLTDGSASVITGLTVNVSNQDTVIRHIFGSIYQDNGSGHPGALLGSFDPVTLSIGLSHANVTMNSLGINLAANTTYWVAMGIVEDLTANTVVWWADSTNATDAGSVFSTVPLTSIHVSSTAGVSYTDTLNPNDFLFSLTGTSVPEPAGAGLMLVGLSSLTLRRSRRK